MDSNTLWHILQSELEVIKNEADAAHHVVLDKAFQSIKTALEKFLGEQVIAGLPHPHPRSRVYRSEPKKWKILDTTSIDVFEKIMDKAQRVKKPACVFDLDGTLFDVGHRTLGIIQEWLASEASRSFDETLLKKVTKISYSHIGYSLSHAFENAGFDLRNQEIANLFSSVERSWKKKFFDGKSLLKYDSLINNSVEFIRKIEKNNITIFYLTGRHYNSMHAGTMEQLKKFSFPLIEKNLILKENSFLDDQIFKSEIIKNISNNYNIVGNFENEYLNLAYMCLEAPEAVHVIVDSQHSGRPTPELSVPICRIAEF
jgi:hypothetical protein